MYLIPITCTIIYIMTEMNELDSVHTNNANQLSQAKHLIQRFIIREQTDNENVIYCMNIILGTIFINLFTIPTIIFISNPINLIVLLTAFYFVSLVIMNKIVSFIDHKYDNYWLKMHENLLKQSAKEK